jgi:hypothetical protein
MNIILIITNPIVKEGKVNSISRHSFVTGYWLLYRKMYLCAVLYLFGWFVIQFLLLAFLTLMNVTNDDSLIAWEIIVAVGMNVTCGFLGNRLYMDKVLREVQKAVQKYPQEADRTRKLRKSGGTSFWFVIVLILQVLLLDLAN